MILLEESMNLYDKVLSEKKYNSPITAGLRQWIITAFGRDGQLALKGTATPAVTPRAAAPAKTLQKFAHPAAVAGKQAPKSAGAAGLGRPKFNDAGARAVSQPQAEEPTQRDTVSAPVVEVETSRAEMVARALELGYDGADKFSDKQLKKVLQKAAV
jgi:hypothetical protein